MSIPLGAISLAGASLSVVTTVLTKNHQKKLLKVTKLTDIVMSAIAIFEMSVSKALSNGKIDEQERIQRAFRCYTSKHLMNCLILIAKWEQKTETNLKKSTGRDK